MKIDVRVEGLSGIAYDIVKAHFSLAEIYSEMGYQCLEVWTPGVNKGHRTGDKLYVIDEKWGHIITEHVENHKKPEGHFLSVRLS